ncbi:MAG: hypothetical protein H6853_00830 [Rhodospirillales bacterium]|nr:hypothetical protein [Alphaproteobacteria bacterium]USO03859.1 MAG: hypothetical protein H6853_00830 [Rhodospirillales bacterium]
MCKFWNKLTGKHQSTASVSGECLVLSLPGAIDPVVWRMELSQVKSSAFEIHERENGRHILCMKNSAGQHEDIAPFFNREDAVQALICVSSALQNAAQHNITVPVAANTQGPKEGAKIAGGAAEIPPPVQRSSHKTEALKWLVTAVGVIVVLGLFFYLSSLTPQSSGVFSAEQTANSGREDEGSSTGVPVSASDFLNGL